MKNRHCHAILHFQFDFQPDVAFKARVDKLLESAKKRITESILLGNLSKHKKMLFFYSNNEKLTIKHY